MNRSLAKKLQMEIVDERSGVYSIVAEDGTEKALIRFDPNTQELSYANENSLTDFLNSNGHQFRKILHHKRKDTFRAGFRLAFSMIDGKDVAAYNDKRNLLVSDHGQVYVIAPEKKRRLAEIYTDGSYCEKYEAGACSYLIKNLEGRYTERSFRTDSRSSALIELEAVIAALTDYPEDVRIITDSQYVRKGIAEWIVHWKLNDWTTASGAKAKNISQWIHLDRLCRRRYVEFEWVKAHSGHFENDYCDIQARGLAVGKSPRMLRKGFEDE